VARVERGAPDARVWAGPERLAELRVGPANARITFAARVLGALTVRGAFAAHDAVVRWAESDVVASTLEARIGAASIDTGIAVRDRHLRGWSYLDAGAHPLITFTSRVIERRPPHLVVRGPLTLRGVTREEELVCTSCAVPPAGDDWTLVGEMVVSRARYGIGRPARALGALGFLDPRPLVIADRVRIRIEVRAGPP
jgi:polyisoprenoid-binding protein YceI